MCAIFPSNIGIYFSLKYYLNKGNPKVALFNSKVSPREKMVYQKNIKSILELTNGLWKCVITAVYSVAGVVISDRKNPSPQHRTMSVTQLHLQHLVWCIQTSGKVQQLWCWSFVIVKHYDGFSSKLERVQEPKGYFESAEQAHSNVVCHTPSYIVSLLLPLSHFEQVEGFLNLTLCHNAKKKYILLSGNSSLTRNKDLLLTTGYYSSLSEYKNTGRVTWCCYLVPKDLENEIMPFAKEHGMIQRMRANEIFCKENKDLRFQAN